MNVLFCFMKCYQDPFHTQTNNAIILTTFWNHWIPWVNYACTVSEEKIKSWKNIYLLSERWSYGRNIWLYCPTDLPVRHSWFNEKFLGHLYISRELLSGALSSSHVDRQIAGWIFWNLNYFYEFVTDLDNSAKLHFLVSYAVITLNYFLIWRNCC